MKTDPNLEDYPRLVPPEVVYEHKASLKKPVVIPLYAKIVSAAAAVALLVGIFWSRSLTPRQELMAELKPITGTCVATEESAIVAQSQARFIVPKPANRSSVKHSQKPASIGKPEMSERVEMPLLAGLQPKTASSLASQQLPSVLMAPDMMETEYLAYQERPEEEDEMSFMRRGFLKMTEGQFDSFSGMLKEGWRSVKVELAQLNESVTESFSAIKQKASDF